MLANLQAKIVLERCRKARADRALAAAHGSDANAAFYAARADFWDAAAEAAAKGDLSPVNYTDDETVADGVRVVLVVVR